MGDGTLPADATLSKTSPASKEQKYPKKRLIVCCDGTWNAGDLNRKALTNVARIARCISDVDDWKHRKDGKNERHYISQIVHYQPGVGMGTGVVSNIYDAMTGRGLSKAIREAYSFICLNWSNRKDEIVLIGFSRGAFTVRCVAQFIDEVGLLTKSGLRHLPRLFKLWKHLKNVEDSKKSEDWEWVSLKERCDTLAEWGELLMGVKIEACAVWDTVSAVGLPMVAIFPQLPRTRYRTVGKTIPKNVKLAIQALALDEMRRHFKPMVWDEPQGDSDEPQGDGDEPQGDEPQGDGDEPQGDEPQGQTKQELIQCWFAGNHSDVGGGNKDMTLSHITLAWMIGQLTDKIEFNRKNLWAITTTRSWSKPSPDDEPADEPAGKPADKPADPRMRNCKVVARAPISPKLLQSKDSWLSFFQRKLGGSQLRSPKQGHAHYSVYIFHHLGIAEYKKYFSPENANAKDLKSSLLDPPLFKHSRFEGVILERWAKHVLCAHIYIKQARNSQEEKDLHPSTPLYNERLKEALLPHASYEMLIPISAILSAFHKLVERHCKGDTTPLDDILNQVEAPDQSRETKATFEFTDEGLSSEDSPPVSHQELVLKGNPGQKFLVFTRVFPLLMGRAHELPGKDEPRPTSKFMKIFKSSPIERPYETRPCPKCDTVWPKQPQRQSSAPSPPHTSQNQNGSRTSNEPLLT